MSFSVAELVASRDPPPVLKRIMLTMTPSPEKLMLTSIMLCPKVQVEVAQVVDGTWWPTKGPGVYGADMELPCGVCLRGGGFGRAAWRPEAARAAPSFGGSSVPGFSEPAASGGRRGDLAAK